MEPTFAKATKEELKHLKKVIPKVIQDIAKSDFNIEYLSSQICECVKMAEDNLKRELIIDVIKKSDLEEDIKEDLYEFYD